MIIKEIRFILAFLLVVFSPVMMKAQWVTDPGQNTVVRDALGLLAVPHVVSVPTGNTYISWYSAIDGMTFDMFLQYFDINGNKLWADTGLMIGDYPTFTWVSDYGMAADNEGYAVVTYQDKRDGFSDAYAYRISPSGDFNWGPDGIQLTNDEAMNWWPQVLVMNDNSFVFTSLVEPIDTNECWKISLQRRDVAGNLLWGENLLTDPAYDYFMPQMLLTEEGSLMVSWLAKTSLPDTMPGQQNWVHVFLQKYDDSGLPVWPEPVQVDSGNMMAYNAAYIVPYLSNNGSDGAYVTWQSFLGDNPTVRVMNVSADGQLLWQPNGIQVEANLQMESQAPSVFYDPADNYLYVYYLIYRYDNGLDCWSIGGQKFSAAGDRLWGIEPKLFVPMMCSLDSTYIMVQARPAPDQQMCMFYEKGYFRVIGPDTIRQMDAYAGLIDADGNYVWAGGNIAVANSIGLKNSFMSGNYAAGQWVTAWGDNRQHPLINMYTDIYAQNITIDGNLGPLAVPENTQDNGNAIACYPNPGNGMLTVSLPDGFDLDNAQISIADITGKTIFTSPVSSCKFTVDVSYLENGIYLMRIFNNRVTMVEKVLIR